MEEPIEAYDPTILTGLGLFLSLYMPVIFMIAVVGDHFLPFGMTTVMLAPIVGMFMTPIGLLVLLVTYSLHKKHSDKKIKWGSALPGTCFALGAACVAWFLVIGFGVR